MEFLKGLLGDKYDEFATLLGDVKLMEDKGEHMIPKSRFDEVNNKYKQIKEELDTTKASQMTDDEKIQSILDEANETKNKYSRELSKLKATEVFVKANISEEDYKDLVESIVTEDSEATVKLAGTMVNVITKNRTEVEKKVKKDLLNDTPAPKGGSGGDDEKSKSSTFAKLANEETEINKDSTLWG